MLLVLSLIERRFACLHAALSRMLTLYLISPLVIVLMTAAVIGASYRPRIFNWSSDERGSRRDAKTAKTDDTGTAGIGSAVCATGTGMDCLRDGAAAGGSPER
jgi:hypothetical protein